MRKKTIEFIEHKPWLQVTSVEIIHSKNNTKLTFIWNWTNKISIQLHFIRNSDRNAECSFPELKNKEYFSKKLKTAEMKCEESEGKEWQSRNSKMNVQLKLPKDDDYSMMK